MPTRKPTTKKEVAVCPWCGILPRITEFRGTGGLIYYVGCESDTCTVNPKTEFHNNKRSAKAAWNKCRKRMK